MIQEAVLLEALVAVGKVEQSKQQAQQELPTLVVAVAVLVVGMEAHFKSMAVTVAQALSSLHTQLNTHPLHLLIQG